MRKNRPKVVRGNCGEDVGMFVGMLMAKLRTKLQFQRLCHLSSPPYPCFNGVGVVNGVRHQFIILRPYDYQ